MSSTHSIRIKELTYNLPYMLTSVVRVPVWNPNLWNLCHKSLEYKCWYHMCSKVLDHIKIIGDRMRRAGGD